MLKLKLYLRGSTTTVLHKSVPHLLNDKTNFLPIHAIHIILILRLWVSYNRINDIISMKRFCYILLNKTKLTKNFRINNPWFFLIKKNSMYFIKKINVKNLLLFVIDIFLFYLS